MTSEKTESSSYRQGQHAEVKCFTSLFSNGKIVLISLCCFKILCFLVQVVNPSPKVRKNKEMVRYFSVFLLCDLNFCNREWKKDELYLLWRHKLQPWK